MLDDPSLGFEGFIKSFGLNSSRPFALPQKGHRTNLLREKDMKDQSGRERDKLLLDLSIKQTDRRTHTATGHAFTLQ